MTFRVGQKVVCINAGEIPGQPGTGGCWDVGEEIKKGAIYTIHSTFIHPIGDVMVRLMEVRRTAFSVGLYGHDGYAAERFRPLIERKTDIGFAHEILRKVSRNVAEPVR